MRKIVVFFAVAFFAVSFTSCVKRDYVCTCNEIHGAYFTKTYDIGTVTNDRAQTLCDQKQKDLAASGTHADCKVTM